MRLAIRRTVFAIATVSSLCAKILRIYAHSGANNAPFLLCWGASFFLQDTVLLLSIRALLELGSGFPTILAAVSSCFILLFSSTNIAFFLVTGFEPQWRNVGLVVNPSAWGTLSVGLAPSIATSAALVLVSTASRNFWALLAEASVEAILWTYSQLVAGVRRCSPKADPQLHLARQNVTRKADEEAGRVDHDKASDETELQIYDGLSLSQPTRKLSRRQACCGVGLLWQLLGMAFRPSRVYATYSSWTMLLIPLVAFTASPELSSSSSKLLHFGNSTAALHSTGFTQSPPNLLADFRDTYNGLDRYIAAEDPLKISNLDEGLLQALKDASLTSLDIRHVVLLTLESTRHDVFPLQQDGVIRQRLAATFDGQEVPEVVERRLASLTPFASWLVGDYDDDDDGLSSEKSPASANWTARGSLVAQDAVTTSTYTIKSLAGTHCGVSPVVADFNEEYLNRIYQPCLPQVFDMFNNLRCPATGKSKDDGKWTSVYMQSTTLDFDHQEPLMLRLGFHPDKVIGSAYLHEQHKFKPSEFPDTNYFGMPEEAVELYLRDTFAEAKKGNERVFLSHLTSTTHHGFDIPDQSEYTPLSGSWEWESLSRYLNAVGHVDRWLGKVMDVLESEAVANETLVVVVGDHGLSIAEQGSYSPYQNPHVASSRVPLVMSLPGLPNINISQPVSALQVLPTVLDLLVETESLSECASEAARDLARNYEGQSLLRPLRAANTTSERGSWQFVVTNPGGSVVAVRDARRPEWRLVVPLLADQEWWFSDLSSDPYEMTPLKSLDSEDLLQRVELMVGSAGVTWIEEATEVTRWWVGENHRRWQHESV